MKSKDGGNQELVRWERFLALFREEISRTSAARPTVRYWKSTDLVRIISLLRKQHKAELFTTFPSGLIALGRLEKLGWVKPLAITWNRPYGSRPALYEVCLHGNDITPIDPLELLQGYEPKGVVCYFGAVQHHELTTQIPPFYHIAKLRPGSLPCYTPEETTQLAAKPKNYNSLGTALFTLDTVQFYETTRYPSLMPGVQTRFTSNRSRLRITDFEQTLLDTITHPIQCGGSAVVFEAWERAADRIDPVRLLAHLEAIDRMALWRRVAAMLTLTQIMDGDSTLMDAFEKKRTLMDGPTEQDELPLLPDHEFSQLNSAWRVRIP